MRIPKTDWSYLAFFLATAVVLEGVATWSSCTVFPTMKGKILIAAIATIILAYLIHNIADEEDDELRTRGVIVLCLINCALLLNCLQHFDFGRELDASKQSQIEINAQKDKDLERERQRADIAQKIAGANAQQLREGRAALLHTPRKQAGQLADKLQSSLIAIPPITDPETREPQTAKATEDQATIKTPAEIRAELMPNLYYGLAISFGLCVIGATFLFACKQLDKDKNGVKDWIERAAKQLGEDRFQDKYPQHYYRHKQILFPEQAPKT